MFVNIKLLRQKIGEKGLTIGEFSNEIGIDSSTFYRKVDAGGYKFTIGQMHKTVDTLNLNKQEAIDIFLQENSQ